MARRFILTIALLIFSHLASSQEPAGRIALIDSGTTSKGQYVNQALGIRYNLPKGWVVNKKETTIAHQFAWVDHPGAKTQTESNGQCSKNLLLVTKHPEGMDVGSFDPLALVVALDPACFPEIVFPKSVTDQSAIEKAADQFLQHLQTPGAMITTSARVRPFEIAGRVALNISRRLKITTREIKLGHSTTMVNLDRCLLIMPTRGYWLAWIFVSADDFDMDYLKGTKIFLDEAADSLPAK